MTTNKFLSFERHLAKNIKDKLLSNQNLTKFETRNLWNNFNICGLNPVDDRDKILDQIYYNIRIHENNLFNIKNNIIFFKQTENNLKQNITYYQNIMRYI